MRRSWAAVTVGILVIVIAIGAGALFRYTSDGIGSKKGYHLYALFNDALGLNDKTQVRTAGIAIGRIDKKTLFGKQARVDLTIDGGVTLYKNAVVFKRAESLLGEFYLEIDPGSPDGVDPETKQQGALRPLRDGDRILNVFEQATVGTIMEETRSVLPILRDILTDVRELTSGQVKEIATNVNEMVAKNSVVLESLLHRVDNIAAHVEDITAAESQDIKVSLQNVREITEGLKSLVGKSEGEVTATGGELRSSLTKLQSSVDKLDKSLENMQTVTNRLKEGEGTAGRLLTDDTIARNVEDITEEANGFLRGITKMQTIMGLRTEYNYLAGTFKNYFQIQLQPRPDKFYLIEIVDDPRGYREASTRIRDTSDKGLITERTITTTERLRFSLQFGKRWDWFTWRFGIKESTGGMGVDFEVWKNRLVLSVDMFDTHSNENPRVQARGNFAVYKDNVFLVAGADDLLNYTPAAGAGGAFFDWFLGLKFSFKDEDLKSMLLFGGSAVGAASK